VAVIAYNKFKPSDKKIYRKGPSTSKETIIVKLSEDINNYSKGSEWLLKTNQFTWIVHEYVAAKLYQWALGKELVNDVVLVSNPKLPNKPYVAIKLDENYQQNFIFISSDLDNSQKDTRILSIDCAINNCNSEAKPKQAYKTKPITGFEKAFTLSRIFNEGDDDNLNNYALKIGKNYSNITRYDFDDSLKFFHTLNITQGMTKDSLPQELIRMMSQKGMSADNLLSQINTSVKYEPFGWHDFISSFGKFAKAKLSAKYHPNIQPFISAFEVVLKLNHSEVKDIIKMGFNEVAELVGEKTFVKHYNFNQLSKLIDISEPISNSAKLAEFAAKMVIWNFTELGNMHKCIKIEYALKNNDKVSLKDFLHENNYNEIKDINCESFYHYKGFRQVIKLEDLSNDYHNEAAYYLSSLGQQASDQYESEL
jgi:hypothetical protein